MNRLSPPDSIHLTAAEGWLELGNHLEANEELENITPQVRGHPDVLEIRWQIYAKESKWDAYRDIAATITKLDANRASGWLHLVYATRRAMNGGLQPAQEIPCSATEKFPNIPTVFYNLACYDCQLGNLKEAKRWLGKAIYFAGKMDIGTMVLDDPDLQQLWNNI